MTSYGRASIRIVLLVSSCLILLTACGATDSQSSQPSPTVTGTPAAMMPGMDHGTMPMTPMTDTQFIDGMIIHHEGAIAMASEALTQTQRPEIRSLAEAIIAAQGPEITQLQTWRTTWYPDSPALDSMVAELEMGQMMLETDPTKEFDQRFLEAMISHHQGAIMMAESIKTSTAHDELRAFAEKVIADQSAEIDQMQAWLTAWYSK